MLIYNQASVLCFEEVFPIIIKCYLRSVEVNKILPVPFIHFICTALLNILEITRGKMYFIQIFLKYWRIGTDKMAVQTCP